MTRKDYEQIAQAINGSLLWDEAEEASTWNEAVRSVANHIAGRLQADNARFDRARFLTAAGVA